MPTSPECEHCLLKGIHSRVRRAYYRIGGKYHEIGWICPTCFHFKLDINAYREELRRLQGTLGVPNKSEHIFHALSQTEEDLCDEKKKFF